jgi:hypothetical protein
MACLCPPKRFGSIAVCPRLFLGRSETVEKEKERERRDRGRKAS